ncbi:lipopolysaccharide assembly protein LapA domain-containing protein [Micromonospora chersina]|uniref:LapA family protein n=1 Tax=Micromonospora chersina TaxID=47854 RepID=UPI0034563E5D
MTAPRKRHLLVSPVNGHEGPAAARPTYRHNPVRRSRIGDLWIVAVLFAIVLLLLLIFVLQNGQRAEVAFLGVHVALPIGVALLLAAVIGVLLVALPGTARILQLRMRDRRRATPAAGLTEPGPAASPATGADVHQDG